MSTSADSSNRVLSSPRETRSTTIPCATRNLMMALPTNSALGRSMRSVVWLYSEKAGVPHSCQL